MEAAQAQLRVEDRRHVVARHCAQTRLSENCLLSDFSDGRTNDGAEELEGDEDLDDKETSGDGKKNGDGDDDGGGGDGLCTSLSALLEGVAARLSLDVDGNTSSRGDSANFGELRGACEAQLDCLVGRITSRIDVALTRCDERLSKPNGLRTRLG